MPKRTLSCRADGRYELKIYLGLDEQKRRKYKTIYGRTPSEVEAKEREIRAKLQKGIDIMSLDDSFTSWVARLCEVKRVELTDAEMKTFEFRCEYFSGEIGFLPLRDVSQVNLQPLVNKLYAENPSTGKPSSRRTIERYLAAVSQVFEYAIENRATEFNPCKYVKIPRNATISERRALTPEERIWVEETPHRAQTAAMLMMYSGLRRGEATALLWSDVDLEAHTISVTKSYDFKQSEIKSPKTSSGFRTVSIPQKLVDYLKGIERKSIYVISTADGRMMTSAAWKSMWDSYMIAMSQAHGNNLINRKLHDPRGIPIVTKIFTPHCLRHTFCTIMYEAGIDVMTAKEQMGHSDVKTTLSIYTHLDKAYKARNISKLDEYLSNSNNVSDDSIVL